MHKNTAWISVLRSSSRSNPTHSIGELEKSKLMSTLCFPVKIRQSARFCHSLWIPIAFVFHPKFFSYRSSGKPCAIYRLFQCDFIIISNLHQKTRKINEKLSTRVDFSIKDMSWLFDNEDACLMIVQEE